MFITFCFKMYSPCKLWEKPIDNAGFFTFFITLDLIWAKICFKTTPTLFFCFPMKYVRGFNALFRSWYGHYVFPQICTVDSVSWTLNPSMEDANCKIKLANKKLILVNIVTYDNFMWTKKGVIVDIVIWIIETYSYWNHIWKPRFVLLVMLNVS